jgi:hypothetical protein
MAEGRGRARRAAVRAELRRVFTAPYEAPIVVAVNGLLMAGAWFLLPPDWFFRVHSAWVFPLSLATWMLADVPATNVLGSDARQMSAAIDRPRDLLRLLVARNVVLWLLVVPVCAVVALVDGALSHASALTVVATLGALAVLPTGTLGIAAWLGVLWPYHPMPLATRWAQRRRFWPVIARWSTLVLLPYVLVPFIATVIYAPVFLAWYLYAGGSWQATTHGELAVLFALAVVIGAIAWSGGHAVSVRLAGARSVPLRDFLADETRC